MNLCDSEGIVVHFLIHFGIVVHFLIHFELHFYFNKDLIVMNVVVHFF